jgi:hypothetical protein
MVKLSDLTDNRFEKFTVIGISALLLMLMWGFVWVIFKFTYSSGEDDQTIQAPLNQPENQDIYNWRTISCPPTSTSASPVNTHSNNSYHYPNVKPRPRRLAPTVP